MNICEWQPHPGTGTQLLHKGEETMGTGAWGGYRQYPASGINQMYGNLLLAPGRLSLYKPSDRGVAMKSGHEGIKLSTLLSKRTQSGLSGDTVCTD